MEAASFCAVVRRERYSAQPDYGPNYYLRKSTKQRKIY
jgi:hypothetical protein